MPSYHGYVLLLLLALIVGATRNVIIADKANLYNESLILLTVIVLSFTYYFTRMFALKAQDRAIRAEENLRHYVLTGKLLDPKLRVQQIVALRFASDEEFPRLVQRALDEKLSVKDIKQAIRNWRADYYRV